MMTITKPDFSTRIPAADIPALQQAIRTLTRFQREELAEWMLNSADFRDSISIEEGATALAYGLQPRLSLEEFLMLEENHRARHELVGGEIFEMRAPMPRHEVIVGNLLANLRAQLGRGPAKVISSNLGLRLQLDERELFYRPDIMVACGPFSAEALDRTYLTDPCVIVEVFSPVTEDIDRREKLLNYQRIPALEEYLLIAQRSPQVLMYRRSDDWRPTLLTALDAVVESRSVELSMSLEEIYAGTRLG